VFCNGYNWCSTCKDDIECKGRQVVHVIAFSSTKM